VAICLLLQTAQFRNLGYVGSFIWDHLPSPPPLGTTPMITVCVPYILLLRKGSFYQVNFSFIRKLF